MPDLNKAYQWAINTCKSPNVGYSQDYRNQKTVGGITYYDCSSFIYYALCNGDFPLDPSAWPFTTSNMVGVLTSIGFSEIDIKGEWKAGDIIWRSGHVEMVYQGGNGEGISMGAHSPSRGVSINSYKSTYTGQYAYTKLLRYGEGGAEGYGCSLEVVSAICGNFWRESHINPGQGEIGGGGGFGLGQWTGSRRTNLENYMRENNLELSDGNGQLAFLVQENDWIPKSYPFPTIEDFLKSDSTDIAYLTEVWMNCWERPGVPELNERIEYAKMYYDYITDHAQDSSITDWITKSTLLSVDESKNNAVMVYRYLSIGGGGGNHGKKKHKMPVWMMCRYW